MERPAEGGCEDPFRALREPEIFGAERGRPPKGWTGAEDLSAPWVLEGPDRPSPCRRENRNPEAGVQDPAPNPACFRSNFPPAEHSVLGGLRSGHARVALVNSTARPSTQWPALFNAKDTSFLPPVCAPVSHQAPFQFFPHVGAEAHSLSVILKNRIRSQEETAHPPERGWMFFSSLAMSTAPLGVLPRLGPVLSP